MRNELFELFNIRVLDSEREGILWISLQIKHTNELLRLCTCYLPPSNSSRAVNISDFFDILLDQFYEYQKDALIMIVGDFNIRVGE